MDHEAEYHQEKSGAQHQPWMVQHGAERSLVAVGEAIDAASEARERAACAPAAGRRAWLRVAHMQKLLSEERDDREREDQ